MLKLFLNTQNLFFFVLAVGLSCQDGKCLCPTGSQWFWSPYSKKCVSCPTGWTVYTDRCYYYTKNTTTWPNAKNFCQLAGGYLIIVDDNSEYNRLVAFYKASGATSLWVLFCSFLNIFLKIKIQ